MNDFFGKRFGRRWRPFGSFLITLPRAPCPRLPSKVQDERDEMARNRGGRTCAVNVRLGGEFDPDVFSAEDVNRRLAPIQRWWAKA